jgi:hypothetical protein
MLPFALTLLLQAAPQQPASGSATELAVISARQGECFGDFTVKDAAGAPIYAATIHVRVRYGVFGLKRVDLEVGTNSDGKARVEGLPANGRTLVYDISKGTLKTTVEQNLETTCRAEHEVVLKEASD